MPPQDGEPPAHWAELVRRRAPWLLRRPPLRRPPPPGVASSSFEGRTSRSETHRDAADRTMMSTGAQTVTRQVSAVAGPEDGVSGPPAPRVGRVRHSTIPKADVGASRDQQRRPIVDSSRPPGTGGDAIQAQGADRVGRVSVVADEAGPEGPAPSPATPTSEPAAIDAEAGAVEVGAPNAAKSEAPTPRRSTDRSVASHTGCAEDAESVQPSSRDRVEPSHAAFAEGRPASLSVSERPVATRHAMRSTDEQAQSSSRGVADSAPDPVPTEKSAAFGARAPSFSMNSNRRPSEEAVRPSATPGSWPSLPDERNEPAESGRWPELPAAMSGRASESMPRTRDHDRRLRHEQEGLGWNA